MIQRGQRLGFALEPRDAIGVVREGLRKNLQRNVSAKASVARAKDLSHAAFAKRGGNLVGTDFRTGSDGHWCPESYCGFTFGGLSGKTRIAATSTRRFKTAGTHNTLPSSARTRSASGPT